MDSQPKAHTSGSRGNKAELTVVRQAEIGDKTWDVIEFGKMDGKPIEWIVLEKQTDKMLVLSKDILDICRYHNVQKKKLTWATSKMREYLGNGFLRAFTLKEKMRICLTRIKTSDNQWFGTEGGVITEDKVFLLSLKEVTTYFGDSGKLQEQPDWKTMGIDDQYNQSRIAKYSDNYACLWWLRSPGYTGQLVAHVGPRGDLSVCGVNCIGEGGVRPALWLDLQP